MALVRANSGLFRVQSNLFEGCQYQDRSTGCTKNEKEAGYYWAYTRSPTADEVVLAHFIAKRNPCLVASNNTSTCEVIIKMA